MGVKEGVFRCTPWRLGGQRRCSTVGCDGGKVVFSRMSTMRALFEEQLPCAGPDVAESKAILFLPTEGQRCLFEASNVIMPGHSNPSEPEIVVAVSAEEGKGAVPGEVNNGGGAQVGRGGEEEFGGGAMCQVTGVWREIVFCQLSLVTKEINFEVALNPSLRLPWFSKVELKEVVMLAIGGHSARLQVHPYRRS